MKEHYKAADFSEKTQIRPPSRKKQSGFWSSLFSCGSSRPKTRGSSSRHRSTRHRDRVSGCRESSESDPCKPVPEPSKQSNTFQGHYSSGEKMSRTGAKLRGGGRSSDDTDQTSSGVREERRDGPSHRHHHPRRPKGTDSERERQEVTSEDYGQPLQRADEPSSVDDQMVRDEERPRRRRRRRHRPSHGSRSGSGKKRPSVGRTTTRTRTTEKDKSPAWREIKLTAETKPTRLVFSVSR